MNSPQAIKLSIDIGETVAMAYLEDMNDRELFHRPSPDSNHINWQLGHMIVSEHELTEKVAPGSMPSLPAGFAERYTSDTAVCNDPKSFLMKDALLAIYHQQHAATLKALEKISDEALDVPSGIEYAPTFGAVMSLHGSHALMHAGQWAVIRRQLGRKPLF